MNEQMNEFQTVPESYVPSLGQRHSDGEVTCIHVTSFAFKLFLTSFGIYTSSEFCEMGRTGFFFTSILQPQRA